MMGGAARRSYCRFLGRRLHGPAARLCLALNRRAGITTVEYALLLCLLVVASIGTWTTFSQTLRDVLQQVANSFAEYAGP